MNCAIYIKALSKDILIIFM